MEQVQTELTDQLSIWYHCSIISGQHNVVLMVWVPPKEMSHSGIYYERQGQVSVCEWKPTGAPWAYMSLVRCRRLVTKLPGQEVDNMGNAHSPTQRSTHVMHGGANKTIRHSRLIP